MMERATEEGLSFSCYTFDTPGTVMRYGGEGKKLACYFVELEALFFSFFFCASCRRLHNHLYRQHSRWPSLVESAASGLRG